MISQYVKNNSLKVIVKPNSKKTEVLGYDENRDAIKITIAAPAEDNKANIELIKFVSRQTEKKVRIISGKTSRTKLLSIE